MARPIDRDAMLASLKYTVDCLDDATQIGRSMASEIKTIFLIGSGSGQHVMQMIQTWIEQNSQTLECFSFLSAKLADIVKHPKMDEKAVAFIVSKSGNTETVNVAEKLRSKAGRIIIFTQNTTNPIASQGNAALTVGDTKETLIGLSMLMFAVAAGIMSAKDNWPHLDLFKASLKALPAACALAAAQSHDWGLQQAQTIKHLDHIYLIAEGAHEVNSQVWGPCILTEWLEKHTHPIRGAEFRHGQHEVVRDMNLIAFLGLDKDDRVIMEKALEFAKPRAKNLLIYDARDLDMKGIAEVFRPMLAPFLMQAKAKRISAHLSVLLNRPEGDRNFESFRTTT